MSQEDKNQYPPTEEESEASGMGAQAPVSPGAAPDASSAIDRWLHLSPESTRKTWVYWRPQTLDFYVLREFLSTWALVLIAMIFMFTIQILMSELEEIVKFGLGFSQTMLYLYLNLPYLLMYMVPVSLLVSLIYVLVTFGKNNEIVALRASGIAMERIAFPFIFVALIVSFLLLLMNRDATADYTERSRQMLIRGDRNEQGELLKHKVQYYQGSQFRFWFIKTYNVSRHSGEQIEIIEQDADGRDIRKIYARSGAYVNDEWQLYDVKEIFFATPTRPASEQMVASRTYSEFIETPRQMLASDNRDIEGMTSTEIREYIEQNKSYRASRMDPYLTTLYYRYAMPFWCLTIALFTVPFAASVTRRAPIVGIAYPFMLFMAFFFVTNFSLALGKGSRLPPIAAAWLAVVFFSILGCYAIYKRR